MSQQKVYEASTIEEALRAVTADLGDDADIIEAVKERRGGVLGFFAKECFVVTARTRSDATQKQPEQEFSELLLQLASGVSDTWEPEAYAVPDDPERLDPPVAAPAPEAVIAQPVENVPVSNPSAARGVIDLRTGRRRPPPLVPLATAAGDSDPRVSERPERQSQLRRRLRGEIDATPQQYVMEVEGPMIDLRDSVPRWSLARLQMLGLPDTILEVVEQLDPSRDLEWVQSLSIAIGKLNPSPDVPITYVIGHGRRSAIDLVLGIPHGRIPAALIIDGQRVKVTPDELALSIRACIR